MHDDAHPRNSFLRRAAPAALWLMLAAVAVIVAQHASYDNAQWLPDDDPQKIALDRLAEDFAPGETFTLILVPKNGVFNPQSRQRLLKLSDALETNFGPVWISHQSPLAAQTFRSQNQQLSILSYQDLINRGDIPNDQAWLNDLNHSLYAGRLAARDGSAAVIDMRLDTRYKQAQRSKALNTVELTLQQQQWSPDEFLLAGDGYLKATLDRETKLHVPLLIGVSTALLALALAFTLRRRPGAFLAIIGAGFVASCTAVAVSTALQHPLTIVTLILPVLVGAIAIADALHTLSHHDLIRQQNPNNPHPHIATLRAAWKPCLLTSVTSAAGFGAFYVSSRLQPLQTFGADAFFSILLAYPLILLSLYAGIRLAVVSPPSRPIQQRTAQRVAQFLHKTSSGKPVLIISAAALIVAASVAAVPLLKTETNFLDVFFADDSPHRKGFDLADAKLGGSGGFDVILDAANNPSQPPFDTLDGLSQTLSLQQRLQRLTLIQNSRSYADAVSQLHSALSPNNPQPSQDQLFQELFFLELSRSEDKNDILSPYLSFSHNSARINVQTPNLSSSQISSLLHDSSIAVSQNLPPLPNNATLTGFAAFIHAIANEVIPTQILSISVTIAVIAFFFLIQAGPKLASIAIASNSIPVVATFAAMSLLHVPLDFATVIVASVILGLSVDDAIHYLHAYKKNLLSHPPEQARSLALSLTAPPMIITSLVFCIGFAALASSPLPILKKVSGFGIFGLSLALFCALLLLPALVAKLHKPQAKQLP